MRWAAALLAAVALVAGIAVAPAPAVASPAIATAPAPASSDPAASPSLGVAGPLRPPPRSPSTATGGATASTDPNALTSPPSVSIAPPGHRMTAQQAIRLALKVPKIARARREHRGSYPTAYLKGATQWQVSLFSSPKRVEIGQVAIDDASATVLEAWTGYQVPWSMARGYEGAFGRRVNALYVWIPLCVLFVAPFLPWRRRPSWLLVDLLVLLSFSVSLAYFNHARIGLSTPLIYPPLLYLLVRMLIVARRGDRPEPLRLLVPASWLAVALVFLIGFRVGLNVTNSNVVDVGYSGVIGANRLMEGTPLYGIWPKDDHYGDTYGPVTYYAYVPFERTFGWSGRWDDLPAAHGAAIFFDLMTILGLFLLGRRIRGPDLGIVLAYAWASFPFTLYVSNANSNDALVSLLLGGMLLVASSPMARGAMTALAGLTKFAPLALAPLFARTPTDVAPERPRSGASAFVRYAFAFAAVALLAMAPVVLGDQLRTFWRHTIVFQHDRGSPFSVWGLYGWPKGWQTAVQIAAAAFALALAFVPRRRTRVQVAALGAAVLIALQLGITYWFYLYVVWFLPFALVALLGRYGAPGGRETDASPAFQDVAAPAAPRSAVAH
jgi:hypothetical protein